MPIPRLLAALTIVAVLGACGDDDDTDDSRAVSITMAFDQPPSDADAETATTVVRQRLDDLGVVDAVVEVDGDRMTVDYPASDPSDPDAVAAVVGEQGALAFRPVLGVVPPEIEPACGGDGQPHAAKAAAERSLVPQYGDRDEVVQCYELGADELPGSIVRHASAEAAGSTPWMIALELRDGADGLDPFNALAGSCFTRDETCPAGQLAIVLDGEVLSAPTIQQPTFDATGVSIVEDFTESEATELAVVLRSGSLPTGLRVVDIETTG